MNSSIRNDVRFSYELVLYVFEGEIFLSVGRDVLSTPKDFHCLEHSAKRFSHSTTRLIEKFKVRALPVRLAGRILLQSLLLHSLLISLITAERRELDRYVSTGHSWDVARNLFHEKGDAITNRTLVPWTRLHASMVSKRDFVYFLPETHSTENVRPITSWILVPSTRLHASVVWVIKRHS